MNLHYIPLHLLLYSFRILRCLGALGQYLLMALPQTVGDKHFTHPGLSSVYFLNLFFYYFVCLACTVVTLKVQQSMRISSQIGKAAVFVHVSCEIAMVLPGVH